MTKHQRIQFIEQTAGQCPVKKMCQVLQISEAGYYKYVRQKAKPQKTESLLAKIYQIIQEEPENANYGVQRIYLSLKNYHGYTGSIRTVYRICKEHHLLIRKKRNPKSITKTDKTAEKSENLIAQNFQADKPNEKWLTDITEIPCQDGKVYLAPVLDCYDGMIVAFSMADHMKASLCVDAFEQACRKERCRGMLLHSDRGSQYTSREYRAVLAKYDAVQSMSGVGRCYDNARMESFFATLKKEKLYQIDTRTMTRAEVKSVVYRYIHYYNLRRIYSTNDGWPPAVYRHMYFEQFEAAC